MSTQWHPLFAKLLKLLLADSYEVQTEVPVSELPRRGDILVIRRQGGAAPPFVGIWAHLTDWNVFEFKGPTDAPEEDDLELLVHVGTGITCKLNEERRTRGEERLANRQVSFWYLTPTLGDTFFGHARLRTFLDFEAPGLWRGKVWGHSIWLLGYRDAAVEVDSLPLHILRREPIPTRPFAELLVRNEELLRRFAAWVYTFQPQVWEEIQRMATTTTGIQLDWQEIGKHVDLTQIIRTLPPEQVIQTLGVERAVQVIGLRQVLDVLGPTQVWEEIQRMATTTTGIQLDWQEIGKHVDLTQIIRTLPPEQVIQTLGVERAVQVIGLRQVLDVLGPSKVVETLGVGKLIDAGGEEKVLEELLARMPPERKQELVRRLQQGPSPAGE